MGSWGTAPPPRPVRRETGPPGPGRPRDAEAGRLADSKARYGRQPRLCFRRSAGMRDGLCVTRAAIPESFMLKARVDGLAAIHNLPQR